MQPTVGGIVHYWPKDAEGPHAAIITALEGPTGRVSLAVFHPIGGIYFLDDVREVCFPATESWDETEPEERERRWSWPPRSES